jgi:hypothetical protein
VDCIISVLISEFLFNPLFYYIIFFVSILSHNVSCIHRGRPVFLKELSMIAAVMRLP